MWIPEEDRNRTPAYLEAREKAAWEARVEATVERLWASLRPEHAQMPLISWANIKKWKLPRRVRPV